MDPPRNLQRSKAGSDSFKIDQLLFDPNSNFDELIPVDDFFGEYINQLEAAGGEMPMTDAPSVPSGPQQNLTAEQFAALQQQYAAMQQAQQQQGSQPQQMQQSTPANPQQMGLPQMHQGFGAQQQAAATGQLLHHDSGGSFLNGLGSGDFGNGLGSGDFGGDPNLGLTSLQAQALLAGGDLGRPDLARLQGYDGSGLHSSGSLHAASIHSVSSGLSGAYNPRISDDTVRAASSPVNGSYEQQAMAAAMLQQQQQYGQYQGVSQGLQQQQQQQLASGPGLRATSAPAFDLNGRLPQSFHPAVVVTGGESYMRARAPGSVSTPSVPSNVVQLPGETPQVVIINQARPSPQQQQQQLPPPQLVIARPQAPLDPYAAAAGYVTAPPSATGGPPLMMSAQTSGGGGSASLTPESNRSPAGSTPVPSTSPLRQADSGGSVPGQMQPQVHLYQQGQQAVGTATVQRHSPPSVAEALQGMPDTTFARLTNEGSNAATEAQRAHSGDAAHNGDVSMMLSGDDYDGEDGEGMSKNRRHRTLRQQMLNKQAQQRYRERKKAKASELEHTVAALSDQLSQMAGVKQENSELQDRNLALINQLRHKEEELERILREQASQPAYMKTGSGRVVELAAKDDGETSVKEVEGLSNTYQSTVAELRALLVKYNLENQEGGDIHGAAAPPETLKHMSALVESVNSVHSKVLRMEGNHAAKFVSPSVDRSSGRHDASRRWAKAAQLMQFTPEQREKILSVRKEHLRRLQRIYEERRMVNLEAISVLLPQERGGTAPSMSSTMEKAKSWLPSMFQRSKHAAKQKEVMKKLKNNLSEEQRLASELDYLVFRRILTPVQGAWFILHKYPAYCDSLSLCNGVAELAGEVDTE